jgi:hypothetical protein
MPEDTKKSSYPINKWLILVILILLVVIASLIIAYKIKNRSYFSFLTSGVVHEMVLTEQGFSPNELTINIGETVRFSSNLSEPFWPASDLHPTHGIYPELDPQEPIEATNNWSFTFTKRGNWRLHDHLKPIYRGIIIVK